VNSGEYKLMGLAPYGEPVYVDTILNELLDIKEDGSFKMNMSYFNYCAGLTMTNRRFAKLFGGPPRAPESKITQREMDIARSIQEVTEIIIMKMAKHIHHITGQKHLVLAGGVALNCVANGRILREGPFKDIWIQPAAGDAGGALGAALYVWHVYLGNRRIIRGTRDTQKASYLGPEYDGEEIESFLKENDIHFQKLSNAELTETVADLLASENVVGWFQGRMEFGPRALGSRSIIGDARSPKMQTIMNLKIKFRESFRPFAPTVLSEHVSEYFELDRESPYMLLVAPVKKDLWRKAPQDGHLGLDKLKIVRSEIPAVTHVDYSARIQTVNKKDNPLYHAMLKSFHAKTGCPVIINTSFNVRGEPIVCTPEDAYRCFMRTNMDYLVLGNYVLSKTEQQELVNDIDWQKEYELD
jgi:carbamoyltransferase